MGGGPSIPQRQLMPELGQIFGPGLNLDIKGLSNFVGSQPLLQQAGQFALKNLQNVGGLISPLQTLLAQQPAQFDKYHGELGALQGQIAPDQARLGQLYSQLGSAAPELQHLIGTQNQVYNRLQPTLLTQGALTPEQQRVQDQQIASNMAGAGMATGNQDIFAQALNRDQYRQQRFQSALSDALGLSGSIGGLTGQLAGIRQGQAGILGQRAGLTQLGAGLVGQQAGLNAQQAGVQQGLTSGIQGVQSGAEQQALGAEQAQVGDYATLVNPLLNYGSDLFSSNQNAAATQSIAGANKSGGLLGGALSAVGSIAAAY